MVSHKRQKKLQFNIIRKNNLVFTFRFKKCRGGTSKRAPSVEWRGTFLTRWCINSGTITEENGNKFNRKFTCTSLNNYNKEVTFLDITNVKPLY